MEAAYPDLLMHTDVRWLSRGKVLSRLVELLPEVRDFFESHGITKFSTELNSEEWERNLSFLADICQHLNVLNESLQRKGNSDYYILLVISSVISNEC